MIALLQRVKEAHVAVNGSVHSSIGGGILIFLGVGRNDTDDDAEYLAQRCSNHRIFEDEQGKMNLSVRDAGGKLLVVPQFTLLADTRKGNRPSFTDAAPPALAERLYSRFVEMLGTELGTERVATGVFRAMMDVHLINDGPVTIIIESKKS
ncbi:MAG TPA: D-aminoacyl-tRNA deacylase [Bacteroidota bacterium]|nr:D-aminoacyl-tRNA deacylase [Bacteroidota bacterium]